jgi:hypothetical protein
VGSGLRNSVSETEWVTLAQEVNLNQGEELHRK